MRKLPFIKKLTQTYSVNFDLDCLVIIPFLDANGYLCGENISASKEGKYYKINSLPFYAVAIAFGDVLKVKKRAGKNYFSKIVFPSAFSNIQVIMNANLNGIRLVHELTKFGCLCTICPSREDLMAFAVPPDIDYIPIKDWLDQQKELGKLTYKESCLAYRYQHLRK